MSKLIYCFLLFSSLAQATGKTIDIRMIEPALNITQMLELQKTITLSNAPKQLSDKPQAICFKANINDYLPKESTTPKPIYGCIFSDQVSMNASLLRAGIFVHTKMGMVSDKTLFNSNLMTSVGGHDFNGEELNKYVLNRSKEDETLPEHKTLKNIEKEFDEEIIKPILGKNKANFIFFAIINTKKYKENLSHELLHAQFYNTPTIKPILLSIWKKMPRHDQETIMKSLQEGGYDMDQQELLLREIFSYFLQYNAKNYLSSIKVLKPTSPLVDMYAPKIQAALEHKQIQVLKVD